MSWCMLTTRMQGKAFFCERTLVAAHQLSFRDALIVSAAFTGNASVIATEDLNHGQRIEGILIQNPFVTESVDEQKPHKSGD